MKTLLCCLSRAVTHTHTHTHTHRKFMTWCQDIHFSWSSTQDDFTNNYFLRAFSNSLSEVHLGEWPGIWKGRGYQEFAFELYWPQFPTQGFFLSWNKQGTKATTHSLKCACKSSVATKNYSIERLLKHMLVSQRTSILALFLDSRRTKVTVIHYWQDYKCLIKITWLWAFLFKVLYACLHWDFRFFTLKILPHFPGNVFPCFLEKVTQDYFK